ncbi:MAG: recombinase family protein [Eubacterium sp.]|nr:recombinase family protein [Eubacterium sp.]
MVYGYCRISRKQQSIQRQERNIKQTYPDAIIIKEAYTGRKMDRPEWNKLYKKVNKGDTIVFDSVSRMSRNEKEGFKIYQILFERGVSLVFLKEPHINTDTYRTALSSKIPATGSNIDLILEGVNAYIMDLAKEQIRIAFKQSEKEVNDLRQRTREGIETARLNGKQIGQKTGNKLKVKKEAPSIEQIIRLSKDYNGDLNDIECMKIIGISRNTYYKYKRKIKESI